MKNFRGYIRTRDQKHNLGIDVSGWILETPQSPLHRKLRDHMLAEQKNADGIEHSLLRHQTHFVH